MVVSVIDKNDGVFTRTCISELHTSCSIPLKDMQHIRVCYHAAKDTPAQLDMTIPNEPVQMVGSFVTFARSRVFILHSPR